MSLRSKPFRQRGMVSVMAVIFLLVAVMFALGVTLTISGSDVIDTKQQRDSVEALYLAESGLEHASKVYGASTGVCNAMNVGAGTYALGRGDFVIVDPPSTTDFSGNPLLPVDTKCRVKVTGRITSSKVARTVETIIEKSDDVLPPTANADFNEPAGVCDPLNCTPTNWILSATGDSTGVRWDDFGGPETPTGTRAAFVEKPTNGPTAGTTAGQFSFSPPVTITGPITLTMTFDFKHEIGEPGNNTMEVTFKLFEQSPGTNIWTSATFGAKKADGWRTGSTTIEITQTGTFLIDRLAFDLVAKAGQSKKIWLDNLKLTGPGLSGGVGISAWREPVI